MNEADTFFLNGIRLNQDGRYAEAIASFERAIEIQPNYYEAWNDRSISLEQLGRYEEAIAGYQKALEIRPDSHQAWYNLGNAFAGKDDFSAALNSYRQAISLKPDYYDAWNNCALILEKLEQNEEALANYTRVLEFSPKSYQAWYNSAILLEKLKRLEEAIAAYDKSLTIRPGFQEAWYNRGIVLELLERSEEAVSSYKRAVGLQPNFYGAWNNLGIVLERLGRYEEAIACYDKALEIEPESYQTWYNLGNVLRTLGRYPGAVGCYEKVIQLNPDYAEAYCNLGVALDHLYRLEEAIDAYHKALAIRPDFPEVLKNLSIIHLKLVPRWHFGMMNDRLRNDCYDRALRKVVRSDAIVLDIGSGSGLLAMMAARAGAKQVISCEVVKPIAIAAQKIVAQNGFGDRISIVNKKSTDLHIGTDMPAKADILVAEIFDVGLLGEDAIPTIDRAREHLLHENAKILPKKAAVYAVLVESQKLFDEDRVDTVSGFDVRQFNTFSSINTYQQKQLNCYPHRLLSDIFEVFSFDFCGEPIHGEEKQIDAIVRCDGKCHGIVFWFRLWLDDEIFIDSSPQNEATHWMQAVTLFKSPVDVAIGQSLKIMAKHDCASISFDLSDS